MDHHKSKRSLRIALVLGTTVAGTALVGFGGLAAWSAYTENAGNSVAAGTLAHANGASCVSSLGVVPVSGTGFCTATITIAGVDPANWTSTVGTIKIVNTGSLNSTFQLSMGTALQAPTGSLCADVTLGVKDLNTTAPDASGVVWSPTALTGTFTAKSLYNNAGTPKSHVDWWRHRQHRDRGDRRHVHRDRGSRRRLRRRLRRPGHQLHLRAPLHPDGLLTGC